MGSKSETSPDSTVNDGVVDERPEPDAVIVYDFAVPSPT